MKNPYHPCSTTRRILTRSIATVALLFLGQEVNAATSTWNGTTDGSWSTPGNWSAGVPAAGDNAIFNGTGNGNTVLDLGAGVTIKTLLFDLATASSYTIGSGPAGSQTLTLDNGGSLTVNSSVTTNQTINSNLLLGVDGTTQNFTLSNNSATSGQLLTVLGGISGSSGTGTKTLTVTGAGNTILSGLIENGTGGGTLALTKTGAGTLTLNGSVANTYTGATRVDAGRLVLDFANAGTPTDLISSQSELKLNGGTLQVLQKDSVATSQSFASTTFGGGHSTITAANVGSGAELTLALGDITANRAAGATVNFTAAPVAGGITTTSSNTNSILGTWATIGSGTSMTYAKVSGGKIVAAENKLGGDINISVTQDKWDGSGTLNYRLTGGVGLTGHRNINALQLGGLDQGVTLGTSNLTLNGLMSVGTGNALLIQRGTGGTGNVVIGANRELVITGSSSLQITAPIVDNSAGASALTYSGSGTLTLTGTSTYTGTTTINAGVLKIGAGGSSGSIGTGNVVNNAEIEIGRSDSFTFANNISGTGSLKKLTGGTTTLSGNNSYSGLTTVSDGTLSIAHNNALGSTARGTTVAGTAMLLLQNGVTVSGETVVLAPGNGVGNQGTLVADTNSTATWAGTVNMSGGAVRVGARDGGVLILSGPITNGTDLTISSYDVTPTGTVVIAGTNNTYTGVTNIIRGTLKLGANNALPVGTILDVHNAGTPNPATFDLGGFSQTVAGIRRTDGAGPSTITNSGSTLGVLTVDNSTNTTYSGNITGGANLALTKNGSGRLTLSGTNTYSGLTTINAGLLRIGDGGTTGSLGAGDVINNAALEVNRSNTLTLSNKISGTGGVTFSGTGTTIFGGANTYTGLTQVNAGRVDFTGSLTSDVNVADGAGIGGEGSTSGSITFNGANSLYFNPSTPAALSANTVVATDATVTLRLTSGSSAATGIVVIDAPGGISGTNANFQFTGRGNTYLSGDSTQLLFDYTPATLKWTGSVSLGSGAFWNLDVTNWDNAGSEDVFFEGDSVVFDDTAEDFSVFVEPSFVDAGNVTFDNSENAYLIKGGAIAGIGSLTKKGTSTLTIANNNTYTGGTTINGGTIQLGDGTSADGALGSGAVTNNAALVTNFGANNVTFSNTISGSGTLTKNGTGTLTVTGNNTFSGGTTISAGTLQLNTGGSLGSGAVTNNGDLILNRAGTSTFANAVGGAGNVTTQNNGLLTFGSANTYSGTTTVATGALMVTANSGVLGNTSGGTIVGSGATLGLSGGITYDAGESLTISGTGIVSTEFFFPGSINQRGALQSVSGDNTWQGNVTITGNNTRIGVQDGARLTLTGTITDGGAGHTVIFRGGTGVPGMITISGTGNSWGRTDVYGSSTRIGADNALPTSAPLYIGATSVGDSIFDLNGFDQAVPGIAHQGGAVETNFITNNGSSDSVLTLHGIKQDGNPIENLSFSGTIKDGPTNKLSVVKAGSFTQIFSGPTTYTGPTDITAGSLAVGVSGSISGSSSINISGDANFNVGAMPGGFRLGSTQSITGGEGITAGTITGNLVASAGSTVAPGLGAGNTGTLSISSGLTLETDAHLSLDIGGVTAGTGHDQLIVSGGNISLSGDLAGSALTFEPTNFQDVFFIIVNNGTGATTGMLNGVGEGGSIFISGHEFQISYTSDFGTGFTLNGAGNDVALLAVPEPSAFISVLSGVGMLLGFRRRRRA